MAEAEQPKKPERGVVAAKLAAAGGPIHGWEGIWKDGLQPGELWDAEKISPVLAAKLASGDINVSGRVCLVPGCGRGYDVLAFAKAGASLAMGLELSATAVQRAEEHTASLGLPADVTKRISFQQGDFFAWGETGANVSEGSVDFGFDYTFLCALQPQQRPAWASTWAGLIAPGGQLVTVIFPIDPDRPTDLGPPFAVTPQLYRDLLDPVGFEEISLETVPRELSHPGRGGMEALGLWRRRRTPQPAAAL